MRSARGWRAFGGDQARPCKTRMFGIGRARCFSTSRRQRTNNRIWGRSGDKLGKNTTPTCRISERALLASPRPATRDQPLATQPLVGKGRVQRSHSLGWRRRHHFPASTPPVRQLGGIWGSSTTPTCRQRIWWRSGAQIFSTADFSASAVWTEPRAVHAAWDGRSGPERRLKTRRLAPQLPARNQLLAVCIADCQP